MKTVIVSVAYPWENGDTDVISFNIETHDPQTIEQEARNKAIETIFNHGIAWAFKEVSYEA